MIFDRLLCPLSHSQHSGRSNDTNYTSVSIEVVITLLSSIVCAYSDVYEGEFFFIFFKITELMTTKMYVRTYIRK